MSGKEKVIKVYPTVQFLYSLYINPHYICKDVKNFISKVEDKDFNISKYLKENCIVEDKSN